MRISNTVRRLIGLITFLAVLVTVGVLLGDAIKPYSYSIHLRQDLESEELEGKEADILFLGASRVYRSYVPAIFEEKLGVENVVNASTSAQPYCGSYYILKEMIKTNRPKIVVFGTGYSILEPPTIQKKLLTLDLTTGLTRLEFMANEFREEEDLRNAFALYRHRTKLADVQENCKDKKDRLAGWYDPEVHTEIYKDKGFVYSFNTFEQGNIPIRQQETYTDGDVNADNLAYLDRIVDLCRENDIRLFFTTGLTSLAFIYGTENYEGLEQFFADYAAEKGVIYHNLNLLKDREKLFPDCMMHDYNHLNGEGAQIMSELYAEILAGDIAGEDTSDYFYSSVDEMKSHVKRVVALKAKAKKKDDGRVKVTVTLLGNNPESAQCQLLEVNSLTGEEHVVYDWSDASRWKRVKLQEGMDCVEVRARTCEGDLEWAWQRVTKP